MLAAIRQWVIKTMMKGQTGVVTTMPKQEIIEMNVQITAERMMRNGINPNDLKTVGQVENVVKQIDTPKVNVNAGVTSVKKADVLDMEGNKISEGSGIMGGKEVKESDAAIKARLDADNKKGIASIKNQKMIDDAIDNASPGFAGDRKYDAQLVADDLANKRFNKDFYDLDQKQQMDLYDEAYQGLTKKKFDPPEDLATGGRVGLFMGSAYPKGAAALREMLKLFGKKSDSVKNPSDILKIVNPKQFNKMLEDPRIYGKFDVEKGIGAPDMIKNLQKKMTSDRQSTVKEMLDAAKNIKTADNNTIRYKNKMIEDMMNKGVDRKMAEEMAETISRMAEDATGKFNTPKLSDEGILQLENILKNMETGGKKARDLNANGGRIGFFKGAQADTKKGKSMSPGTTASGGFRGGGGNDNPPPVVKNPPPKPKDNKIVERLKAANTSKLSPFRKFLAHDKFTDQLKARRGKNYHELGGLDFMARFPDTDPDVAKGLASAYQTIFEGGRAIADGPGGYTLGDANKRAKEEARLNAVGIDAFSDPDSSLYQEYTDMVPESGAVQMADGGRIGYKAGSIDKMRRLILKAMGAGPVGIGAAKSGIFSGFGKGAGKTVAKEVAQQTTSSMPPPYFFKLAEKIKKMGDDATATTDRTIAKTLDSKDGKSTYLLEEDVTSGDTIIKKVNKEGDEMITDVEIMEFRKGEVVMGKNGKPVKTPDEYEEVTEANMRIEGDTFNDPYYSDGIQVDEIIKEVDDKVPSIKYASGGLAYMLGE